LIRQLVLIHADIFSCNFVTGIGQSRDIGSHAWLDMRGQQPRHIVLLERWQSSRLDVPYVER
jgi:hypothetical protein